jgi:hypothetical protein
VTNSVTDSRTTDPDAPSDAGHKTGTSAFTIAGWASLGVGIGAAAAATYFGLHAMSLKNDADRDCPGDRCAGAGASENHDAIRAADWSTGFAIGAGVGVAAGVAMLVTGALNQESRSTTGSTEGISVRGIDVAGGPGSGVMTVRGRW